MGRFDDDLEDTFRTGPPGGLRHPEPTFDDTADTGEMLAAVETDDLLEDAGPTTKDAVPRIEVRPVRVVERARVRREEPPPPPPKVERPKLRLPSVPPARAKAERPKYDPFEVDNPPEVGVDPAVFPIHRTAPDHHLGQRIIFGLVAVMMALIVTAFVVGGDGGEASAVQKARQESARARMLKRQQRTAQQGGTLVAAVQDGSARGNAPLDRASRVHPPKKRLERAKQARLIRRADRKPFEFASGKVEQPRKYGDHEEHVPPPGAQPLLVLMSTPQALVFRDGKLAGATPMLVPVDPKIQQMTVTLKTHGYKEKTIDLRPAASGNFEASVTLEKDPAFAGLKVVNVEKPKDKRP